MERGLRGVPFRWEWHRGTKHAHWHLNVSVAILVIAYTLWGSSVGGCWVRVDELREHVAIRRSMSGGSKHGHEEHAGGRKRMRIPARGQGKYRWGWRQPLGIRKKRRR